MPQRKTILANEQIYHVFNRTLDHKQVFTTKTQLFRASITLWYYRYSNLPIPISKYLRLSPKDQVNYHNLLINTNQSIQILCHCLMPNHFHLVVKQQENDGISKYLANFENSYTHFYNKSQNRNGSLFQSRFKAVRIETDEQFLHLTRYCHLNPHTGFVIKTIDELDNYTWSSWQQYMGGKSTYQISDPSIALNLCGGQHKYRQFVFDHADYQRQLHRINHLILE